MVGVTPYAGVWIETSSENHPRDKDRSLPTRECGLKLELVVGHDDHIPSLPTRECGLKPGEGHLCGLGLTVTPYAGVWIETPCRLLHQEEERSHSLRGSVD